MKIISKFLYIIIGLLIAICLFIVFCEYNPGVTKYVSGITKEIAASASSSDASVATP